MRMKKITKLLLMTFLFQSASIKAEPVHLYYKHNTKKIEEFFSRSKALALNVSYQGIPEMRRAIGVALGFNLEFFKGWNELGEAHVTVVTPPEMEKLLVNKEKYMSLKRINEIALENKIQSSDLNIKGLGSGRAIINGKQEFTFFMIVESENLLKIRKAIYQEFVKNGGGSKAWDYQIFYPHITIGYTKDDLHIDDGVIKDMQNSFDHRFDLKISFE